MIKWRLVRQNVKSSFTLNYIMLQITSNIIRDFARKTQSRLTTYYSTVTMMEIGISWININGNRIGWISRFYVITILYYYQSRAIAKTEIVAVHKIEQPSKTLWQQMSALAHIAFESQENCNNKAVTTRYRPPHDRYVTNYTNTMCVCVWTDKSIRSGRVRKTNFEKKTHRWCKTNKQ